MGQEIVKPVANKPISIQSRRKKSASTGQGSTTTPARQKRERKQEPIIGCITVEYYGEDDSRTKLWDDLIASFMDPIIEEYLKSRSHAA